MTKTYIVQRLLDNEHITPEEAVVLLSKNKLEVEQKFPIWNPWVELSKQYIKK